MDFKKYLESSASSIDEKLDEILSDFLNQTKKTNIKLLPFALGLLTSCKGGKRIRGVLVKLGFEIAGGSANVEILRVGAAFEILHAALLIHDDIMDQSPIRRGQPSLYQALGGNHYGISQAINVGDIGLYLPIKIITETNFLSEYKIKALNHLSQTIINTGWGQILDVEGSEDTKFIHLYKTAKYTIAGPLILGAILAGADQDLIRVFGEFGESLGIAFQIRDDILDRETASLSTARLEVLEYAKKAKKIIPQITTKAKFKKILEEMTEYMVERNK